MKKKLKKSSVNYSFHITMNPGLKKGLKLRPN